MSWYATEELEEAWEQTEDILLPFDRRTWAQLILIVVLTGQGMNLPSPPSGTTGTGSTGSGSYDDIYGASSDSEMELGSVLQDLPEPSMTGLATAGAPSSSVMVIAALLVSALVLGLLFISSVFEFIYYQSLLDKDVKIRENFMKHLRSGVRYFGFRLGMLLLTVIGIGVVAGGFALNPALGVLGLLAALLVAVPAWIFLVLTHNFVLLGMIESGSGVIETWRSFWPDAESQWKEVLVYLLTRAGISIVFGIAGLLWAVVTLVALAVIAAVPGILLYLVSPALAVIPVILAGIAWLILLLGAQVVFQTYLYNYAILVYQDLTG